MRLHRRRYSVLDQKGRSYRRDRRLRGAIITLTVLSVVLMLVLIAIYVFTGDPA